MGACDRRFIPAGAGNTGSFSQKRRWDSVYPRWRGEHWFLFVTGGPPRGLSPLARGTHRCCFSLSVICRFIPAGAGNTHTRSYQRWIGPVYPRWRGEHKGFTANRNRCPGLSPLARGTPTGSVKSVTLSRFIPAGAGNTLYSITFTAIKSVYPRWRGEHVGTRRLISLSCGLSPLARGTR